MNCSVRCAPATSIQRVPSRRERPHRLSHAAQLLTGGLRQAYGREQAQVSVSHDAPP